MGDVLLFVTGALRDYASKAFHIQVVFANGTACRPNFDQSAFGQIDGFIGDNRTVLNVAPVCQRRHSRMVRRVCAIARL